MNGAMNLLWPFTIISLFSCTPQKTSSPTEIVGVDERTVLRPGERASDPVIAKVLDSVFVLAEKCSAFVVKKNIAVTAGHCFTQDKSQDLTVNISQDSRRSCRGQSLQLKKFKSQCTDIIALEVSKDADFAIFYFSSNPEPDALVLDTHGVKANSTLRVAGLLPNVGTFFSAPCFVNNSSQILTVGAYEFAHSCDTVGGASGAPVFDAKTGRVLGIHNGGVANESNLATSISVIGPILSKLTNP